MLSIISTQFDRILQAAYIVPVMKFTGNMLVPVAPIN